LLLLFASEAGKKQQQKKCSRGPAAPAAPAGELASSIMAILTMKERKCESGQPGGGQGRVDGDAVPLRAR